MCYAKPGPRCSGHARAKMVAARDDYDFAVIVRDQIPEPVGPREADNEDDNEDDYLAVDAADAAVADATAAYTEASREFHTTPQGIRALEDHIEQVAVTPPVSAQNLARLHDALIRGRATRTHQLAAFAATRNPVRDLPNSELKSELADLIDNRMPAMADDPDGLVVEQARFNTVLDEIAVRRDAHTWRSGRDLPAGDGGPSIRAQMMPFSRTDADRVPA